jgi:hypothetical protein
MVLKFACSCHAAKTVPTPPPNNGMHPTADTLLFIFL